MFDKLFIPNLDLLQLSPELLEQALVARQQQLAPQPVAAAADISDMDMFADAVVMEGAQDEQQRIQLGAQLQTDATYRLLQVLVTAQQLLTSSHHQIVAQVLKLVDKVRQSNQHNHSDTYENAILPFQHLFKLITEIEQEQQRTVEAINIYINRKLKNDHQIK